MDLTVLGQHVNRFIKGWQNLTGDSIHCYHCPYIIHLFLIWWSLLPKKEIIFVHAAMQQQSVFQWDIRLMLSNVTFRRRHFWLRLFLTGPVLVSMSRKSRYLPRSHAADTWVTPNEKKLYQNIRLYVTFISVCGDWLEIFWRNRKFLADGLITK